MENNGLKQNKEACAEYEIQERCLIIRLTQELDHHSAVALREKSDRIILKSSIKNIIFDFEKVTFMDSSGIGVIMGRYKKVIFIGGKVAVTNVNNAVDRIFNLSGLYKIIEKYETVKEAVRAL